MSIQNRNGLAAPSSASAPRPTTGDGTPLTKESGRVRDDSHALAPARRRGRVPGPLDPSSRRAAPLNERPPLRGGAVRETARAEGDTAGLAQPAAVRVERAISRRLPLVVVGAHDVLPFVSAAPQWGWRCPRKGLDMGNKLTGVPDSRRHD